MLTPKEVEYHRKWHAVGVFSSSKYRVVRYPHCTADGLGAIESYITRKGVPKLYASHASASRVAHALNYPPLWEPVQDANGRKPWRVARRRHEMVKYVVDDQGRHRRFFTHLAAQEVADRINSGTIPARAKQDA
jgi:hypothetical protein